MKKSISLFAFILVFVLIFTSLPVYAAETKKLKVGDTYLENGVDEYVFTAPEKGIYTIIYSTEYEFDESEFVMYTDGDFDLFYAYDEDFNELVFNYLEKGEKVLCNVESTIDNSDVKVTVEYYGNVSEIKFTDSANLQYNVDVYDTIDEETEETYLTFFDCLSVKMTNGATFYMEDLSIPNDETLTSGSYSIPFEYCGLETELEFTVFYATDYIDSVSLPSDFTPVFYYSQEDECNYSGYNPYYITVKLKNGKKANYDFDYVSYYYLIPIDDDTTVKLVPVFCDSDGELIMFIADWECEDNAFVTVKNCQQKDISEFEGEITGDADRNGILSAKDARLVLRYSAKLETMNYVQKECADVNIDGKVNAKDARTILRVVAKLEEF